MCGHAKQILTVGKIPTVSSQRDLKTVRFIPFGLNIVEHVVVNFLYHFDWKLPNGLKPQELDMTEVYGANKLPKNPLQIVPVSKSLEN